MSGFIYACGVFALAATAVAIPVAAWLNTRKRDDQ